MSREGVQECSLVDGNLTFSKNSSNILSISSLKDGNLVSHKGLHGIIAISNTPLKLLCIPSNRLFLFQNPFPEADNARLMEDELDQFPSLCAHLIEEPRKVLHLLQADIVHFARPFRPARKDDVLVGMGDYTALLQ